MIFSSLRVYSNISQLHRLICHFFYNSKTYGNSCLDRHNISILQILNLMYNPALHIGQKLSFILILLSGYRTVKYAIESGCNMMSGDITICI